TVTAGTMKMGPKEPMSVRCSRRCLLACTLAVQVFVVARAANGGLNSINPHDLKEWLSYIASDELGGRAVFTSGIGLAAAYIENYLRAWGARPAGDNGSYLQTVRVLGI